MHVIGQLMQYLKTRSDEDYLESVMGCFASPVVSKLKCARLLNLTRGTEDMAGAWNRVGESVSLRLGLGALRISFHGRSELVLLYDDALLKESISSDEARSFLRGFGYPDDFSSIVPHLEHLAKRFESSIPHEVGVFLGYPVEDVAGFIENGGRRAKLSGYWKVYGDEAAALAKFEDFRRAENTAARFLLERLWNSGPATRDGVFCAA